MSEKGKVYLIGAGCGKYDLITLRGKRLLSESDVVVYDSLVDKRLLGFAGKNAELISVGKRCGKPSEKQEHINEILVKKASEGKTVARLKGGDPFIFGRGGEEIFALKEAGIEYEVVPGITSCSAVPELAGIPVTHRKVSRGFHVVTGHTAEDLLPENMSALAKENDTLVFLMGFSRLREIAEILIANGKSPDTPAAVISNGCTSSQRVVRGKLCDIAEISEKSEMCSPAVIVVGETAGLDLAKTLRRALDGVTISVVGTESFLARMSEKLEKNGADVNCITAVKIVENRAALNEAISRISEFDALVFTSANGVNLFFTELRRSKTDVRIFAGKRFAVIGSATASALESYGIFADIIPDTFNAESLANALVKRNDIGKTLILRAKKGSEKLNEILDKNGSEYLDRKIYDAVSEEIEGYRIASDYLVFASSSGVESFFENGFSVGENTIVTAIGEQTAGALKRHGIKNISISERSDADGILRLILRTEVEKK
ncbi:MAG: uroporphyrinogen-III C-methyltransferase [Oscillospiraceae bacterium]|nr:uroporphyrinogen-III C-methyltransferase [Oscillospiraceae bacterium]